MMPTARKMTTAGATSTVGATLCEFRCRGRGRGTATAPAFTRTSVCDGVSRPATVPFRAVLPVCPRIRRASRLHERRHLGSRGVQGSLSRFCARDDFRHRLLNGAIDLGILPHVGPEVPGFGDLDTRFQKWEL